MKWYICNRHLIYSILILIQINRELKLKQPDIWKHMKQKRENISKLVYERKKIEAETRYIQELKEISR